MYILAGSLAMSGFHVFCRTLTCTNRSISILNVGHYLTEITAPITTLYLVLFPFPVTAMGAVTAQALAVTTSHSNSKFEYHYLAQNNTRIPNIPLYSPI